MIELEILPSSSAVGRTIVERAMPPGLLIVFLERNDTHVAPGGGTVLQAGCRLHLFAERGAIQEVRAWLAWPAGPAPQEREVNA